jgi:hypothetical protein
LRLHGPKPDTLLLRLLPVAAHGSALLVLLLWTTLLWLGAVEALVEVAAQEGFALARDLVLQPEQLTPLQSALVVRVVVEEAVQFL